MKQKLFIIATVTFVLSGLSVAAPQEDHKTDERAEFSPALKGGTISNTILAGLKECDRSCGDKIKDKAKRKAREGRNPQTGKEIKIPAKKVTKFKPGKDLAEEVRASGGGEDDEIPDELPDTDPRPDTPGNSNGDNVCSGHGTCDASAEVEFGEGNGAEEVTVKVAPEAAEKDSEMASEELEVTFEKYYRRE